jgi:hypothetical protein
MISSKSPRKVAMVALAAGKEAFSDYSSLYSPHKFTQPQLFACLVLKEFENQDYRGIWQKLIDETDLRQVIGLGSVPHFTTLQKASRRLLVKPKVRLLIKDTVKNQSQTPACEVRRGRLQRVRRPSRQPIFHLPHQSEPEGKRA